VGWSWLATLPSDDLREPARLMAYLVQKIYLNGPASSLGFPDIEDPELGIETALASAGLIEISNLNGIRRWHRRF